MARKTTMISVRMDDVERRQLIELCCISGLPVSTVIRKLIAGQRLQPRRPTELHALYVEINRIGTNINQIARRANAGFATRADVQELKTLLRLIAEQMTRIANG